MPRVERVVLRVAVVGVAQATRRRLLAREHRDDPRRVVAHVPAPDEQVVATAADTTSELPIGQGAERNLDADGLERLGDSLAHDARLRQRPAREQSQLEGEADRVLSDPVAVTVPKPGASEQLVRSGEVERQLRIAPRPGVLGERGRDDRRARLAVGPERGLSQLLAIERVSDRAPHPWLAQRDRAIAVGCAGVDSERDERRRRGRADLDVGMRFKADCLVRAEVVGDVHLTGAERVQQRAPGLVEAQRELVDGRLAAPVVLAGGQHHRVAIAERRRGKRP